MRATAAQFLAAALVLCQRVFVDGQHLAEQADNESEDDVGDPVANTVVKIESTPPRPDVQAAADAENAHTAAESAKMAARLAKKVAVHSVDITQHAQSALKLAHDALKRARADSHGLSTDQSESLQKADAKLTKARTEVDYGKQTTSGSRTSQRLQSKLDKANMHRTTELEAMRKEMNELHRKLDLKRGLSGDSDQALQDTDAMLDELDSDLEELEKKEAAGDTSGDHEALKNEIGKLGEVIDGLQAHGDLDYKIPRTNINSGKLTREMAKNDQPDDGKLTYRIPRAGPAKKKGKTIAPMRTLSSSDSGDDIHDTSGDESGAGSGTGTRRMAVRNQQASPRTRTVGAAVSASKASIDIDTEMPYGELEPFGREDTAQELTEESIKQSNEMVDQFEKAEVAEEKRSVFRALTRLRGAAITSFDGVARSQTGNIDEYGKVHQWRTAHPLHHLADEESDISKWAFPDNADF